MNELTIDANIHNLDQVMNFVNESLEASNLNMKVINQINIAVEEIFVNIAYYAYNPEVGDVTIRIHVDDEVTIQFEDNGKPYNPLFRPDPDITKTMEERDIGGLGVFMVKKVMDSVEYYNKDSKNILVIKKLVHQ